MAVVSPYHAGVAVVGDGRGCHETEPILDNMKTVLRQLELYPILSLSKPLLHPLFDIIKDVFNLVYEFQNRGLFVLI